MPFGAYASTVSAGTADPDAAKAFVKWLWVDQTESQVDFATAYGFHVPVRASLQGAAETLSTGPAAEAVAVLNDFGFAQTPILWSRSRATASPTRAREAIITQGADPATEIAKVQEVVEAELERIGAGSSTSAAPGSEAPATTG